MRLHVHHNCCRRGRRHHHHHHHHHHSDLWGLLCVMFSGLKPWTAIEPSMMMWWTLVSEKISTSLQSMVILKTSGRSTCWFCWTILVTFSMSWTGNTDVASWTAYIDTLDKISSFNFERKLSLTRTRHTESCSISKMQLWLNEKVMWHAFGKSH